MLVAEKRNREYSEVRAQRQRASGAQTLQRLHRPVRDDDLGLPGFDRAQNRLCDVRGRVRTELAAATSLETAGAQSVPMKYDAATGKFRADVPIAPSYNSGDTINYYIVAADSRGNVISMTRYVAGCTLAVCAGRSGGPI